MSDNNEQERDYDSELEEVERRYTLSITDEDREASFATEDERWEPQNQIRDWVILIIAVLFWVGIQLSMFFLVPGIK